MPLRYVAWPKIDSSTLPNGLPIHRVDIPGTRAATVLVAFDAGARTERPEENGMAHFLEHLVFKGGEKYNDYRKVNETAERMGAVLNAYTSHDLVAFHITCRAEVAADAIDLLTDFVGRPKIDAEELDRERGVVIQEIARSNDQPSVVAEHLIDRAAFGDHPLGRPVLGPEEHLRTFTREAIVAFRTRQWAGARGGAFLVGNLAHAARGRRARGARSAASRRSPATAASSPRRRSTPQTLVEERDSNQSHLRMSYRPTIDPRDPRAARGADASTRRCWAARWARDCSTRSASSAASPTPSTRVDHVFADVPILQLRPAWSPASASRPTRACARSSTSCAPTGPSEDEFERARAYAAGRRVLAFENTNAVARHAADQTVVFGQDIDPDAAIAALDETTFERRRRGRRGVSEELSVACVGPHTRGRVRLRTSPSRSRTRVHRNIARGFGRAELERAPRGRPVTKTKGLQFVRSLRAVERASSALRSSRWPSRYRPLMPPSLPRRWTSSCSASTTSTATCSRSPPAASGCSRSPAGAAAHP